MVKALFAKNERAGIAACGVARYAASGRSNVRLLGVLDKHREVAEYVHLIVAAGTSVDEHGAARSKARRAARVDSHEGNVVFAAAPLDGDIVDEGGRRRVGKVHLDRVVALSAIDAQAEGTVGGSYFEGVIVREAPRPAEIDVDVILSGAAEDVDVEQAGQLDGVALVDAVEVNRIFAATSQDVEVGDAAGMGGESAGFRARAE